ncbi:MAG: hypothetical protein OXH28_08065 [bacterium]|nr:hypothetical protein [bacterium]
MAEMPGRQLIIAVSVPRRDFAAVLVGCGWVLASEAPRLEAPPEVLRGLSFDSPVRLVVEKEIVSDYFIRIRDVADPQVKLRNSSWLESKIRAAAELPSLEAPRRSPRPRIGSVARQLGLEEANWDNRLASPAADLAIVGTRKWLQDDFKASIGVDVESVGESSNCANPEADPIAGLLLPDSEGAATWSTRLFASSRLADQLPLPREVRAAVLDGAGAVKYLTEIEAPLVICILDRSVADDAAGEIVVQLRNVRGEPYSLRENLGWRPPTGVEALAFTVPL